MATNYHGPTPVTKSDVKMAKKHLKATKNLLEDKIDDHLDAMKSASKADNQASVKYNKSHLSGHQTDMKQVSQSLRTVMKGKMMANNIKTSGSYKGKSNAPGGGGRSAQMKAQGMSGGLIGSLGRKKYGSAQMAKWSAAGKK